MQVQLYDHAALSGVDPAGWIGWLATPSLGSLNLEIKKRNKTITEATTFSDCSKILGPPLTMLPGNKGSPLKGQVACRQHFC